MLLRSQSYDFDVIVHAGVPLGVEWLCWILSKSYGVFDKFEIFITKLGEKRTSAQVVEDF